MTISMLDELRGARALITKRINWTVKVRQKHLPNGGIAFCALGALDEMIGEDCKFVHRDLRPSIQLLAEMIPNSPLGIKIKEECIGGPPGWEYPWWVSRYNNRSTHAEVLAWFDAAIARQETIESLLEPVVEEIQKEMEMV